MARGNNNNASSDAAVSNYMRIFLKLAYHMDVRNYFKTLLHIRYFLILGYHTDTLQASELFGAPFFYFCDGAASQK
jgi:hypothetical protein